MSFTDWCKLFTDADVCRVINTSLISIHKTWNEVVHFGSWTRQAEPLLNRCGGCANHKQTFLQNPQVLIICTDSLLTPNVFMHMQKCIFTLFFQFLSQYLFDVTKEVDEVLISLQQRDMKIHRKFGQGENLTIGFSVFKVTFSSALPPYCIDVMKSK